MEMKLISVNIGCEKTIEYGQKSGLTGIFKEPVSGLVEITPLGLRGDVIVDTKHHGGPDQAIYIYTSPDYAWWSAQLGYELEPGAFGDNLTISHLESARLSVGDILRVGPVVLQVTAPRIPCSIFAARMGLPDFVNRFRRAGRPGLYCRVIQPGLVQAGDPVTLEPYSGPTVTILEMFEEYYEPHTDEALLRRYLSAPLAIRARQDKEKQLKKLSERSS